MPMRYNSLVGDLGTDLSGGQKQRRLLARALYKAPKILLLDEATSHLDVGNEAAVNNDIEELSLTRIIIAHRPEKIAMASRVFVLEHGKVDRDFVPSANGGARKAATLSFTSGAELDPMGTASTPGTRAGSFEP
jgi:ATP-binding cassette, subfamily B, bacterial CvaB/MchF/RaxB